MIVYKKGDLFQFLLTNRKPKVIPHIVNNIGKWGAGFTRALSQHFDEPRDGYLQMCEERRQRLGGCEYFQVISHPPIVVANMCAQKGVISRDNPHPLDYVSLDYCLIDLSSQIYRMEKHYRNIHVSHTFEIHMPKIGSGLAGGKWDEVSELINKRLAPYHPIVVYEY